MRTATILLSKNFSMLSAGGQTLVGDWIDLDEVLPYGSEFENATLHTHCQTIDPATGTTNGIQVGLRTSYDTVEDVALSTMNVTAPGSQSAAISSGLERWVRVVFQNGEIFQMMGILSVWLQLKRT